MSMPDSSDLPDPAHGVEQVPGAGPLPTLGEDEELEDDATGLVGRLPLADFAESEPSPLAFP